MSIKLYDPNNKTLYDPITGVIEKPNKTEFRFDKNGKSEEEKMFLYVELSAKKKSTSIISVRDDNTILRDKVLDEVLNKTVSVSQTDALSDHQTVNFVGYNQDNQSGFFTNQYTDFIHGNPENELRTTRYEGFGIKSIDIETKGKFMTTAKIVFVDATMGKNLKDSPYDVLFSTIPMPLFNLKVKGYYGYVLEYVLIPTKIPSVNFSASEGIFNIEMHFVSNFWLPLTHVLTSYLYAMPFMGNAGGDKKINLISKEAPKNFLEFIMRTKTLYADFLDLKKSKRDKKEGEPEDNKEFDDDASDLALKREVLKRLVLIKNGFDVFLAENDKKIFDSNPQVNVSKNGKKYVFSVKDKTLDLKKELKRNWDEIIKKINNDVILTDIGVMDFDTIAKLVKGSPPKPSPNPSPTTVIDDGLWIVDILDVETRQGYRNFGYTSRADYVDIPNGLTAKEQAINDFKPFISTGNGKAWDLTDKLPLPLRIAMADFYFNHGQDARIGVMQIVDPNLKRGDYYNNINANSGNDKNAINNKYASLLPLILSEYAKDPFGFLDKYALKREEIYKNTNTGSPNYPTNLRHWLDRVAASTASAKRYIQQSNPTPNPIPSPIGGADIYTLDFSLLESKIIAYQKTLQSVGQKHNKALLDAINGLTEKRYGKNKDGSNFTPTIKNVFKLICDDVDKFYNLLYDTAFRAEKYHKNSPTKVDNGRGGVDGIHSFPIYATIDSSNKSGSLVERLVKKYPNHDESAGFSGTNANWEEVKFVDKFFDAIAYQTLIETESIDEARKTFLEELEVDSNEFFAFNSNRNFTEVKQEYYYKFKDLVDMWIKGNPRRSKLSAYPYLTEQKPRLIDNFIFVDRVFNDIGDECIVDMSKIVDLDLTRMTVFEMMGYILDKNGFNFFPCQNFMLFDRENEWVDAFDTIENIEVRTTPAFVCMYVGGSASHTTTNGTHPNDGVDLNNPSKIPPDFRGEKDLYAFRVGFGESNESYFTKIDIKNDSNIPNLQSITINDQLGKMGGKNIPIFQGQSMFDVYESRSYYATVTMVGNMMIQPTQHFQLDNIPIFNGLYYINSVNHSFGYGTMTTTFSGFKVSVYVKDLIRDFIKSIDVIYDNLTLDLETVIETNIGDVTESKPLVDYIRKGAYEYRNEAFKKADINWPITYLKKNGEKITVDLGYEKLNDIESETTIKFSGAAGLII